MVEVVAGHYFAVAREENGNVRGWGGGLVGNGDDVPYQHYCEYNQPTDLGPVKALAATPNTVLALLDNGTVASWKCDVIGVYISDVPIPHGLDRVIAIAAGDGIGDDLFMALRDDHSVVVWDMSGIRPVPPELGPVKAIAASGFPIAVLKDGSITAWNRDGTPFDGRDAYSAFGSELPEEWSQWQDVVDVAASGFHAIVLRDTTPPSDASGNVGSGDSNSGTLNLTGTWTVNAHVNATDCGEGITIETDTYSITQTGTALQVQDSAGNTFSGNLNGQQLQWSGSYPEDGGITSLSITATISGDGNSLTGGSTFNFSSGSFNCAGSSAFTGQRN